MDVWFFRRAHRDISQPCRKRSNYGDRARFVADFVEVDGEVVDTTDVLVRGEDVDVAVDVAVHVVVEVCSLLTAETTLVPLVDDDVAK